MHRMSGRGVRRVRACAPLHTCARLAAFASWICRKRTQIDLTRATFARCLDRSKPSRRSKTRARRRARSLPGHFVSPGFHYMLRAVRTFDEGQDLRRRRSDPPDICAFYAILAQAPACRLRSDERRWDSDPPSSAVQDPGTAGEVDTSMLGRRSGEHPGRARQFCRIEVLWMRGRWSRIQNAFRRCGTRDRPQRSPRLALPTAAQRTFLSPLMARSTRRKGQKNDETSCCALS